MHSEHNLDLLDKSFGLRLPRFKVKVLGDDFMFVHLLFIPCPLLLQRQKLVHRNVLDRISRLLLARSFSSYTSLSSLPYSVSYLLLRPPDVSYGDEAEKYLSN